MTMDNLNKLEKEVDLIQRETNVALREKQVWDDRQAIGAKKAELTKREKAIIIAEQKRDAGFADERSALDNELRDKRNKFEAEISNIRAKEFLKLEDEIAEQRSMRLDEIYNAENMERERIRAEIVKEREAWATQQNDDRKKLNAERTELEKQKGALSALQSEVEGRKVELERAERMIERKEQRLEQQWQRRNEQLQDEVEEQIRGTEYETDARNYISECQKMTEIERTSTTKEKTGVFIGSFCRNSVNGKSIPVYIADYVLMGYGTGAVIGTAKIGRASCRERV